MELVVFCFVFGFLLLIAIFSSLFKPTSKPSTQRKSCTDFQYENKKKGDRYEIQIGRWYQELGYKVYFKGINEGRRDGGIDLIAYKGQEVVLIQCKNWENSQIKQEHLRIFVGDCAVYVEQNAYKLRKKCIRRAFVTSCERQEYAVKKFVQQNKIDYLCIPYAG